MTAHRGLRSVLAALFILAGAVTLPAQVSGQTTDLSSPGYDAYHDGVPDLTTALTHDGTGGAISDLANACKNQGNRYLQSAKELERLAANPKIPGALRQEALKTAKTLKIEGGQARGDSSFFNKAGKVLDALNVFNAFVKAAGYLAEGDRSGAKTVLVDETIKKVTTTITTALGSAILPGVGSTAGGIAGEEFHKRYTGKWINDAEFERFVKDRKDKMLGPDIPRVQVMDWRGNVRELEKNEYIDEAGNKRERSPEEQKAFEDQWKQKSRDAASSDHPLDKAARDLKEGRIGEAEFDRIVDDYNNPKPEQGRVRGKGPRLGKDPDAPDTDELDEENEEIQPPEDEAEEEDEETADELGEPEPPKGDTPDILKVVKPMQVRATGSIQEDYSSNEFKNIVTTTATLSFWNVGALAPGYGKAVITYKAVASLNNSESQWHCSGTFSGGPAGTFHLSCEGDAFTIGLLNGTVAKHGPFKLTVDNPGAFANWP